MSTFGEQVRWRRTAMGISQGDLAAKIRRLHQPTTQSYISRIESGEIDPRVSTIKSLARALKCKPWQLMADLADNDDFWRGYLGLSPQQKRDIQHSIKWMIERRG